MSIKFDEIGVWSEVKLEILKKYAKAYSKILANQEHLEHVYIDGFSGAGTHVSKVTGADVEGSPRLVLTIRPPFNRYYFIDLDGSKADYLRESVGSRPDVEVLEGDANNILIGQVFPAVKYEDYKRALCLLDPYGLQLHWEVILAAGQMKTIDLFLNFPVMDINRNTLWRNPEGVKEELRARMTRFWGDETWFDETYERSKQRKLFDEEDDWIKATNPQVAEAFRQRLRQVAAFKYVPEPVPMRNSKGAVIYYLFFATPKPVAADIIEDIFAQHR